MTAKSYRRGITVGNNRCPQRFGFPAETDYNHRMTLVRTKRKWLQFGLRTFLLIPVLVGVAWWFPRRPSPVTD